jgi:hypothetical protein
MGIKDKKLQLLLPLDILNVFDLLRQVYRMYEKLVIEIPINHNNSVLLCRVDDVSQKHVLFARDTYMS